MRLILTIPFYYCYSEDRTIITKKNFIHYNKVKHELLNHNIDLKIIAVGSEGILSKTLASKYLHDSIYIEHNQSSPYKVKKNILSQKFQRCITEARKYPADIVLLAGSNDFISTNFFIELKNIKEDIFFVGIGNGDDGGVNLLNSYNHTYFWTDGNYKNSNIKLCGGIIGWSTPLLKKLDYKIDFGNVGDETRAEIQALKYGKIIPLYMKTHNFWFWSIKYQVTPVDEFNNDMCEITSFEYIKNKHKFKITDSNELHTFLKYYYNELTIIDFKNIGKIILFNWFKYTDRKSIKNIEFYNLLEKDDNYCFLQGGYDDMIYIINNTHNIIFLHHYNTDINYKYLSFGKNVWNLMYREKTSICSYLKLMPQINAKVYIYLMDFWNRKSYQQYIIQNIINYKLIIPTLGITDISKLFKNIYIPTNVIGISPFYCYKILPFNKNPLSMICLSGSINKSYNERLFISNKKLKNIYILPYENFNLDLNHNKRYIQYLNTLNKYICCIATGIKTYRQDCILHKFFEILSTGSLLLCSIKDIVMINKLGLYHNQHCMIVDLSNMNTLQKTINFITSPKNRTHIDMIRLNGYSKAINYFTSANCYTKFKSITCA